MKQVREKGAMLLDMRSVRIDGFSDNRWHEIVKGIDLQLRRGEVVGLIGESGAGKSSLGLAAMGYAKPGCKISSGQILFQGEDLAVVSERRLRELRGTRIAYVAQSAAAAFNPAKTLLDQTIESAVRHKIMSRQEAQKRAVDLYRQLQLPNPDRIGRRYPHQVSGGQLQRAMTAMAMLSEPDLIIFDEPTTALDVTTQVEVLASIRNLVRERNTAALYITHDLAVVSQMADRIMVMRYGAEVETASTLDMLDQPKAAYTKTLWAVRNFRKPDSPPVENAVIEIESLDVNFGAVAAVNNVSLRVPRGRTVSLVGESGSGKSTVGRAIVGLVTPDSGRIKFEGAILAPSLNERSRDSLRRIQLVHQLPDTAMNPKQTVRNILARPLELFQGFRGKSLDNAVCDLLDRIELTPAHADRLPNELSGGQKQRICLARALAAQPDLIICDEITSALDQVVQEEILQLLLGIQKESNVSYLFITHDIATVRAISDEVVVMKSGCVVERGTRERVLDAPTEKYTELLMSSVPQMDPAWLDGVLSARGCRG
jgi:peptide/nickel transport system ATP-binding protein